MIVDPVTKEIPLIELEEAQDMIHKALTPLVPFDKNMATMIKNRDEERERQLYLLLGWVQTKI